MKPTEKQVGADLVARYNDKVDLYTSGWADYGAGRAGAELGARWRF